MKYFEKTGAVNTEETLEAAFYEAEKRGIKNIIIASTWGDTAKEAIRFFKGRDYNAVTVTHNTGFKEPGVQEFSADIKKLFEEAGGRVLHATMPTRTIGRAIKDRLGFSQDDIACAAWRMFGEGTKVCIEIASMACDAGLIEPGDAIAIAGTGRGADTALLLHAMPSNMIFNIKVKEVLCKPKNI